MLLNGFRNAKFLTIESPSCLRNNLVDINAYYMYINEELCMGTVIHKTIFH